ncbi:DUF1858 domain-containing protein [Nitratifractor sp.]|uniref:DUF1858 domain-containing protein n=1 Tax=Nitratifractor sp. TaxID=2268144 RepID=UPI0025E8F441|nr:DUF1858 domain-containing protein [Nitratifractor sp.]
MKEITMETKVSELLNDYPGMKETLIAINPKFKKLNNPVLRRTLAKVASVKQAAIVGGMDPLELLNRLRESVGQPPVDAAGETAAPNAPQEKPAWGSEEPKTTLDANALLDAQKNPLAEANLALKKIGEGEFIALHSDFKPEPLIEEFQKAGREVYCEQNGENAFITYVRK